MSGPSIGRRASPDRGRDLRLRRGDLPVPFTRLAQTEERLGLAPGTLAELFGYGLDVPEPTGGEAYTNKWHLLEIGAIEVEEYSAWVDERSLAVFGRPIDVASRLGSGVDATGIYWMVLHEVRRLRAAGYKLAICTNNVAPFRATWQQQFPIDWFDVLVDSSEVGVRKPTRPSTCSPATASAWSPRAASSSTTTPATSPARRQSAWPASSSGTIRGSR